MLYVGSLFNRRHVPELIEGFARLAAQASDRASRNRRRQPDDAGHRRRALIARSGAADRIRAGTTCPTPSSRRSTRGHRRSLFCPIRRLRADAARSAGRRHSRRRARHRGRARDLRPGGRVRRAAGARPHRGGARARARRRRPSGSACSRRATRRSSATRGTSARSARCRCCWRARNERQPCRDSRSSSSPTTRARDIDVAVAVADAAAARCLARDRRGRQRVDRRHAARIARERWPGVRLIEPARNLGFAAANNLGIRETSCELVLLLNPDTVCPPARSIAWWRISTPGPTWRSSDRGSWTASGRAELSFGAMISPLAELRQKMLVAGNDRGVPPIVGDRRSHDAADARGRLGQRRVPADSARGSRSRRACSTSASSSTPRTSISAHRSARAAAACCSPQTSRSSTCAAVRPGATTAAAYRRSQLAFYEKHHPAWVPWLRAYLKIRGELPDNP